MLVKVLNSILAQVSRLPLRTVLVVPFVLQTVTAVGLVGYLSFRNGQQAVNDLAERLMREVSSRILQSLQSYTATPRLVNQINTNAIRLGQINLQDSPQLERHLWHQIQAFNSVTYIQFATEQKDFIGVHRLDDGKFTLTISGESTKYVYTTYALDRQGNPTQLLKRRPNYDPRIRPWYKAPVKASGNAWTEIYAYFDFSKLAITEGVPLYDRQGKLLGVTAVDLSLSQISEFLRTLEVGSTGQTYIVERNGMLVASSTSEQPFIKEKAKPQRLLAVNSKEPLIRSTAEYLQQKYGNLNQITENIQLKFDIEGKHHWVQITPFSDKFGLDWLIVVVVPESDFMAQIHANTRTTIVLCLAALFVSTLLGWLTSRWISQPIRRLSQGSQNIASGELDQQVDVQGTQELTVLAQSFNQMAEQLRIAFAALKKTKAELEIRVEQRTAELKESQDQLQQQAQDLEERVRQRTAELLEAKEAAEAADEAKSTFLATMSHELRTPLNAILGFAQLMKCDSLLSPSYRENLNIIARSGEHLLALINDILDMSKIESGRMLLMENSFDFYLLLDSVEQMFQLQASQKGLTLQFERSPEVPQYVNTDERKLRQILINLLGNGIKFTQRGGVTVRVLMANGSLLIGKEKDNSNLPSFPGSAREGKLPSFPGSAREGNYQLHFEIEDTGCGIPNEEIEDLFEPFVQSKTNRGFQEGTGLGLPISRAFVRLMGGDLTLVRTAVGEGTTFAFDIQVTLAAAAEVEVTVPLRRVIGLEVEQPTYRLLVVEDGWENRQLLIKLLQPLGFEVKEAVNGLQALEVLQSWKPHLIWMDLRMPVMDGYEATQQIRAKLEGEAMAIIALTAHVFKEERAAILSAGFDDCVSKPFREAELFAAMSQHLGVRYIYEEPTTSEASKEENVLSGEDFASLPAEWLKKLEEAILMGDMKLMEDAIGQIRTQDDAIALAIAHCLDNFEYDKILHLIEAANQLLTTNP
ncbi:hybrid sensor histidine kinase/response regulator [Microseira wollei]|uniref:histidine kinase n=1 Tax=Microseira wollei NIES-4236 TaxID=2530354 RepID=A0AAV3XII8_9CYAN|nr:hybrid sensor histidine kinase/response regulator [Microseira wollei]GET40319.1 two-component hybrid sensor and regulator [Microseira wollei NIES-4236]